MLKFECEASFTASRTIIETGEISATVEAETAEEAKAIFRKKIEDGEIDYDGFVRNREDDNSAESTLTILWDSESQVCVTPAEDPS